MLSILIAAHLSTYPRDANVLDVYCHLQEEPRVLYAVLYVSQKYLYPPRLFYHSPFAFRGPFARTHYLPRACPVASSKPHMCYSGTELAYHLPKSYCRRFALGITHAYAGGTAPVAGTSSSYSRTILTSRIITPSCTFRTPATQPRIKVLCLRRKEQQTALLPRCNVTVSRHRTVHDYQPRRQPHRSPQLRSLGSPAQANHVTAQGHCRAPYREYRSGSPTTGTVLTSLCSGKSTRSQTGSTSSRPTALLSGRNLITWSGHSCSRDKFREPNGVSHTFLSMASTRTCKCQLRQGRPIKPNSVFDSIETPDESDGKGWVADEKDESQVNCSPL